MSARDNYLANFYKNAIGSLTPDAGTTPVINSTGPGTQPVVQFMSGGKQYYFTPAIGREYEGFNTNLDGTRDYVPSYIVEPENFSNWSNESNWGSSITGLPTMKADWAADLVNNSVYKRGGGATEYTGGGWISEAPIPTKTWEAPKDNESWLSQFLQGPAIPLGGFIGAGAFNSGGFGNFFNSFGGGGSAAGAAGGAMDIRVGLNDVFGLGDVPWGVNPQSGGNMFDPLADFGADYFSGAGDYAGGGLSAADAANIDSWLANEGNFANDILGTGPRLPNGTPVDLFLKNIQVELGLSNKDLISLAGRLGAAGLGALASNQQANSLKNLAGQYSEYGAPYRAMLAQSYANPSAFLANSPDIKAAVDQGTSALARALSVRGNPAQSGTALQEMQNYATQGLYGQLGNERQRLANFGGLTALTSAVPSLSAQAIGANSGMYNALGYGLQQLTNPQPTIDDLMKAINTGGLA